MSRTYRRRGARHDYDLLLRDHRWVNGVLVRFWIDPRSKEGRRAIARFHSDAFWTLKSTASRWYRRIFDHHHRTLNTRQLRRWLDEAGYDPVFEARHRHRAKLGMVLRGEGGGCAGRREASACASGQPS